MADLNNMITYDLRIKFDPLVFALRRKADASAVERLKADLAGALSALGAQSTQLDLIKRMMGAGAPDAGAGGGGSGAEGGEGAGSNGASGGGSSSFGATPIPKASGLGGGGAGSFSPYSPAASWSSRNTVPLFGR